MKQVRIAHFAMGTQWEMILHHENEDLARGLGEDAFQELDRLERQLSFYRSDSDIREINSRAGFQWVLVEPRLFDLLWSAMQLYEETDGAFDVTIGPLMRAWGFIGASGTKASDESVEEALKRTGMHRLAFDHANRAIRFQVPGMEIDLGAIGKGYALDILTEDLRDMRIESGLIHGGTSSVSVIGAPPNEEGWGIGIADPRNEDGLLAQILLKDEFLSVSSPRYKSFVENGRQYGHVLDPIEGEPASGVLTSALTTTRGAIGDGLSTALLVRGEPLLERLCNRQDVHGGIVLTSDERLVFGGRLAVLKDRDFA